MPKDYCINDLVSLMARLRDPELGCPWDLKQNFRSITASTIEEAYEVVDAIERDDLDHLKEELGDLLFQTIFYSQLAAELNRFDFNGVVDALVKKLIRRHPHVFPDGSLDSHSQITGRFELDVKHQWESIKSEERTSKGRGGVMDDVPAGLPALLRAFKLQKRAASVGFDWEDAHGVLEKVQEEMHELQEAAALQDRDRITEELGDLLFSIANFARHWKIDAEASLRQANQKFAHRFNYIENRFRENGLPLNSSHREQMELYWNEAKLKGPRGQAE